MTEGGGTVGGDFEDAGHRAETGREEAAGGVERGEEGEGGEGGGDGRGDGDGDGDGDERGVEEGVGEGVGKGDATGDEGDMVSSSTRNSRRPGFLRSLG